MVNQADSLLCQIVETLGALLQVVVGIVATLLGVSLLVRTCQLLAVKS